MSQEKAAHGHVLHQVLEASRTKCKGRAKRLEMSDWRRSVRFYEKNPKPSRAPGQKLSPGRPSWQAMWLHFQLASYFASANHAGQTRMMLACVACAARLAGKKRTNHEEFEAIRDFGPFEPNTSSQKLGPPGTACFMCALTSIHGNPDLHLSSPSRTCCLGCKLPKCGLWDMALALEWASVPDTTLALMPKRHSWGAIPPCGAHLPAENRSSGHKMAEAR
jgi:hypothetical protein